MTMYDEMEGREKCVSIRLDERLFLSVKELAEANDRSVSAEIRQALRNYLREAAAA